MAAEVPLPRYGVAGWPVAHSRSPQMHRAAYAALGIDAIYQRLPLPPELFAETVVALPQSGFRGINVTIPHKHAALALANEASAAATAIGAANTLTFTAGGIHAANTDAPALIEALIAALGEVAPRSRVLVLGAGGTARAAVWALADAGAQVTVWNRTSERAAVLSSDFGCEHASELPEQLGDWDILVNCTSIGMADAGVSPVGNRQLAGLLVVADFVYGDAPTAIVLAARAAGCHTVEGGELLARQGALSFAHWFGVEPPLAAMLDSLE